MKFLKDIGYGLWLMLTGVVILTLGLGLIFVSVLCVIYHEVAFSVVVLLVIAWLLGNLVRRK